LNLNAAALKKPRQPKAVAPRLMGQNHPQIGLPATNERAFNRSINAASAGLFGSTTCRECFFDPEAERRPPFLRTQLQSSDQRAIVVQSGGRRR